MTIADIEALALKLISGEDATPPPPKGTPGEDAGSWIALKIAIPIAIRIERERCAKVVDARAECEQACADVVAEYRTGSNEAMLYAKRSLRETARTIREG